MLAPALACATLAHGMAAWGQWSGSLAVVSDYRFRGVSLSENGPAVQAGAGYDHPEGLYGGVFGSTVRFAGESTSLQGVAFAGYTHRVPSGWSWEAGADYAAFSREHDYDYGEVYAGVAVDNVSGRVYYARDYFGQDTAAVYAEVNATGRVLDRVDLFGHVGVLWPHESGGSQGDPYRSQVDVRLGAGIDVAGFALRAAWVGANTSSTIYPIEGHQRRNTVVVSVTRSF